MGYIAPIFMAMHEDVSVTPLNTRAHAIIITPSTVTVSVHCQRSRKVKVVNVGHHGAQQVRMRSIRKVVGAVLEDMGMHVWTKLVRPDKRSCKLVRGIIIDESAGC